MALDESDKVVEDQLNTIRSIDSRLHPKAYLDVVMAQRQERASLELAAQIGGVWKPIREVRDALNECRGSIGESTGKLVATIDGASRASEHFASQLAESTDKLAKSTDALARWTRWLAIATIAVAVGTLASAWLLYSSEVENRRDREHQIERVQEPPAPAAKPR
jgi:hypothetical protein